MNEISLGLLERLDLHGKPNGHSPEDTFIRNSLLNHDSPIKQILCYTKDKDHLLFDNLGGLKELKIPLFHTQTEGNTKKSPYKRKSNNQRTKRVNPYSDYIDTDLSIGYSEFKPKSNKDLFKLDDLFYSITHLIQNKELSKQDLKILSLRRVLTLLKNIPINLKDIRFNVIYWQGLIIIDYDWEYTLSERNGATKYQYSGHRFEQVMTGNFDPTEFYSLVNRVVNGSQMHYTAEIDAAVEGEVGGLDNYVELKTHTSSAPKLSKDNTNYKLKLLKSLCQISLIDCKNCLIGYRSNNCQLKFVKNHTREDIEQYLKSNPIFLNNKIELTHQLLEQWFQMTIQYVIQNEPILDVKEFEVHKLSYTNNTALAESTLSLKKVENKDEKYKLLDETIPKWFQRFYKSAKN